jgi:hypothetical protein
MEWIRPLSRGIGDDRPYLRCVREQGSFRRLATTTPPQSPIAWSTLITSLDPGQHGILISCIVMPRAPAVLVTVEKRRFAIGYRWAHLFFRPPRGNICLDKF